LRDAFPVRRQLSNARLRGAAHHTDRKTSTRMTTSSSMQAGCSGPHARVHSCPHAACHACICLHDRACQQGMGCAQGHTVHSRCPTSAPTVTPSGLYTAASVMVAICDRSPHSAAQALRAFAQVVRSNSCESMSPLHCTVSSRAWLSMQPRPILPPCRGSSPSSGCSGRHRQAVRQQTNILRGPQPMQGHAMHVAHHACNA